MRFMGILSWLPRSVLVLPLCGLLFAGGCSSSKIDAMGKDMAILKADLAELKELVSAQAAPMVTGVVSAVKTTMAGGTTYRGTIELTVTLDKGSALPRLGQRLHIFRNSQRTYLADGRVFRLLVKPAGKPQVIVVKFTGGPLPAGSDEIRVGDDVGSRLP